MKRLLSLLFGLSFMGAAAAGAGFFYLSKNLPDVRLFDSRKIAQSSKIYDRTGKVLLYEIHGDEKRTIIPLKDIPKTVKDAIISIEDTNFYNHDAVDFRSIARALIVNIAEKRIAQGASTITQQLARNAFLTSERTILRKLKEFILAYQLERKYSKDEILELYLNQIPYGSNIYGVEEAGKAYFGKSAKDLNLAEVSVLAAMPKAPSYYSPWGGHREELLKRKDLVLEKMFFDGYLTKDEYEKANKIEFDFLPPLTSIKAPHFVMEVISYL